MADEMKVAVCGAGAWGTAMALHWSGQGSSVALLPRRPEHAERLRSERENAEYLPGFPLLENIIVPEDEATALAEADIVFMASPSYALRSWCERIGQMDMGSPKLLISLAKGLELDTWKTPTEILEESLPDHVPCCLSGPTFAGEVAAGKPTAMTLALNRIDERAQAVQAGASGANMRIYLSDDLSGVELGGCLKNVYAIAAGCCQGLGLGDNAMAALLTRALTEMARVGVAMGARQETFYGLSGFGDLVATCHGEWSRNRTFGEMLAKGRSATDIISSQRTAVEGYRTARAFREIFRREGVEAPILDQVFAILYENKEPSEALRDLMNRDLKRE